MASSSGVSTLVVALLLLAVRVTVVCGTCPTGGTTDRCGNSSISQYGDSCKCRSGLCCSRFGFCGPTSNSNNPESYYCGTGCQPKYGDCKQAPLCPTGGSNDFCGVDGTGLPTGGFATPCQCAGTQCCSQYGYCQPDGQCQIPGCQHGRPPCPPFSGGSQPTSGQPSPPTSSTPVIPPAPWLYVEGNSIKVGGQPWFARGVNLPDPRACGACSKSNAGGASYQQLTNEAIRRATAAVQDWKAQVLRVGVYTDPSAGDTSPSADANYLSSLTSLVNHATNTLGVYVMLAVWVDPANSVNSNDVTAKLNIPNNAMVTLWQKLAAPFANNPRVLFAITNEPHCADGEQCTSDHDSQVRNGMESVVQAIRKVEAANSAPHKHIVVAQGCRNYALSLDCYVGNRLTDTQVVYEAHVYTSSYGSVLTAASSIPVIVGEVGPKNSPSCGLDMSFASLQTFLSTLEQRRIPYMGWTFHQYCEPNLLKDVSGSSNRCGLGMSLTPVDDSYGSSGSVSRNCGSNVAWGCWLYKWLTTYGNRAGATPGPQACSSQLTISG